MDDTQLLDAWVHGDDAAGREFYRRYADRIARFFLRKRGEDAADLVQRTFLKCLEQKKNGAPIQRIDAFLFAVARNELYDAFRRDHREGARFDPEVTSLADLRTSPSGRVARDEDARLLLEALRKIPLEYQLAVELYYWEELPMQEVATALGITKSAAINRVHRARDMIRSELDRDLESWMKSFEDLG